MPIGLKHGIQRNRSRHNKIETGDRAVGAEEADAVREVLEPALACFIQLLTQEWSCAFATAALASRGRPAHDNGSVTLVDVEPRPLAKLKALEKLAKVRSINADLSDAGECAAVADG